MNTEKNCVNCQHGCLEHNLCNLKHEHILSDMYSNSCSEWKPLKDEALEFRKGLSNVLSGIEMVLLEKNKRYGNSALEPIGVFSKQDSTNSICIRIDDKIGRIKNSTELRKNDVFDLIGYLILLCISKGWTSFKELID